MQRRDFLKISFGTLAWAGLPLSSAAQGISHHEHMTQKRHQPSGGLPPRRIELLDADWRFAPAPPAKDQVVLDHWVWQPGTPNQVSMMTSPTLDTAGGSWKPTTPGADTLAPDSYGWFRTMLPPLREMGRVLHFGCVDDNGTVYLNGKELYHHIGYGSSFDVPVDSAWNETGPNVLTVLVHNIGGSGGITQPVTLGIQPDEALYQSMNYDDSHWRKVHLPHDYIVEGKYDPSANEGHGFLPVYPAWYRRTIHLPDTERGKSVWLYFEGIFANPEIYLNGKLIHVQPGGYDSFHVNIAPYAEYGADNILAIHVDPTAFEGWWYEGGGIYRHVWLNVADPVHVAPWGVYVTSEVSQPLGTPSASLTIQSKIVNEAMIDQDIILTTQIMDADGQEAARVESSYRLPPLQEFEVRQTAKLASARLWSLEKRNLYHAVTTISVGGHAVDQHTQSFGVRTIRFDPNDGFFLNEKHVKLQGTCNHQDFVGVGIGMPDSLLYWRMKQLRDELGCNAIRCSHNPMSPAMYEACDDLGLVVMDESRHPGDEPQAKTSVGDPYSHTHHVTSMVRRDRNHPSVIMWSMANEEWAVQGNAYGAQMLTALMEAVHRHDTTRPITTAVNEGPDNGWMVGFGSVEDILGVNYNYGDYDYLHQKYPQKPLFGSETGSNVSCRGNYVQDKAAGHCTSYMTPESAWQPLAVRPFVAGGFCWTGFDYRGEPTPFGWPDVNSNFGLLDMCGFPKDAAFYYKAWWKPEEPLVHVFPHWNWAGKEGQTIPVWCFSNCESVELYVNGKSQGRKEMPLYGHVQWDNVVYEPGTLEAIGQYKTAEGRLAEIKDIAVTTGRPAALHLVADRTYLKADAEDTIPVAVAVVDGLGRVVPTADNIIQFSVTGQGRNAGVGNGDPSCHEPNQAASRSAFNGLCMVLVQSNDKIGGITLEAMADGLAPAAMLFQSMKGTV